MSIRAAKYRDHWRTLFKRNYNFKLTSLAYSGLKVLHDGEIQFSPGITAIVGGNGVGKSTLVHAVVEVLSGKHGEPALHDNENRISGCSLVSVVPIPSGK